MSRHDTSRAAAVIATCQLTLLGVFQILLAAGLPLGLAAYGGQSATLSAELRQASVASALLCLLGVWTVLVRAGRFGAGRIGFGVARILIWGFAALFTLSAMANFASSSPWERFGWAPFAVLLVINCVLVALGPLRGDARTPSP